jgi:hypothetical protein
MFFRNISRTGSLVSCVMCVALSAVYVQLDEKQKMQESHAELMEQRQEDRIRAMHTQRVPPAQQKGPQ